MTYTNLYLAAGLFAANAFVWIDGVLGPIISNTLAALPS